MILAKTVRITGIGLLIPIPVFDPAIGFKMSAVTYLPPTFVIQARTHGYLLIIRVTYDVCLVAANIQRNVDTICKEDYL